MYRRRVIWVVAATFMVGLTMRGWVRSRSLTACIDRWVLWIALPALVVSKMSRASFGASLLVPVAAAWTSIAVSVVLVSWCARHLGLARPVTGAMLLTCALGNTSFLGIGVVEGVLGDAGLESAIAYDQLGSFLALSVYGSFVTAVFGGDGMQPRAVVMRIVRFVPFVALLASPLVGRMGLPHIGYQILDVPAATVAPVAMFGLGLRFPRRLSVGKTVIAGLVVKMAATPLVLLAVALLAGSVGDPSWNASILQAAMPPMVTAGIVAVRAGFDEELVASLIGIGTLASVVTLPLWSVLLG